MPGARATLRHTAAARADLHRRAEANPTRPCRACGSPSKPGRVEALCPRCHDRVQRHGSPHGEVYPARWIDRKILPSVREFLAHRRHNALVVDAIGLLGDELSVARRRIEERRHRGLDERPADDTTVAGKVEYVFDQLALCEVDSATILARIVAPLVYERVEPGRMPVMSPKEEQAARAHAITASVLRAVSRHPRNRSRSGAKSFYTRRRAFGAYVEKLLRTHLVKIIVALEVAADAKLVRAVDLALDYRPLLDEWLRQRHDRKTGMPIFDNN